jgi:AraC-like DNA-binding protein
MEGHELYLVRSGCFSYRTRGADVLADSTLCLMGGPRHEADIGHPASGGDTGTAVLFSAYVVAAVGAGSTDLPPVSAATPQLRAAHHRLLHVWSKGQDPNEVEEWGLLLLAEALKAVMPARVTTGAPRLSQHARLCDDARAAMIADPSLSSIVDVARAAGCSPHHLSRIFREQTGETFSEYRRALRLSEAVEQILDGQASLADIAAACGFADHAHLTRTLRRQHQLTPTMLRRLAFLQHRDESQVRRV